MDMVISGRSTWDIFEKPEFGRIILIACRNRANCFNRRRVSFSSVANYACRMNFARSVIFLILGVVTNYSCRVRVATQAC